MNVWDMTPGKSSLWLSEAEEKPHPILEVVAGGDDWCR
jgi:hypothetical protein